MVGDEDSTRQVGLYYAAPERSPDTCVEFLATEGTLKAMTSENLERARRLFAEMQWSGAYAAFTAAGLEAALAPDDLERLAITAHMAGMDEESLKAWEQAFRGFDGLGRTLEAFRCAFWLGFILTLRGEMARSAGWLARARRLVDARGLDSVERGYLLIPPAVLHLHRGENAAAYALSDEAARIAERFGDPGLRVMTLMGRGQALVMQGEREKGLAMLDEVMVAVSTGEAPPIITGLAYCVAVDSCRMVFDLRRAQEWTEALTGWCASQAGLVPYRQECMVHRSEILLLHGNWPDALEEARRAAEDLGGQTAAGPAYYQLGELRRLRGEFALAEEAYRLASRWGRSPQPGLALLRLAQGDPAAAVAAIRVVRDERKDPLERAKVLPAAVEIMLSAGEGQEARRAAEELWRIAQELGAPLLQAEAAKATGAVFLSEGDHREGLPELRRSLKLWQDLDAPYEAAQTRILIGIACRELGDHDTAALEFDAARWAFERLGAAPDLARLDALAGRPPAAGPEGLTQREVEVLRLVAAGKTNQAIAADLYLSEHTVRRHLQNIFSKLGVSSRAAATAFAFQNDLA
jgi:ATP/maltotriose-dependent transcriptional regulator MalT